MDLEDSQKVSEFLKFARNIAKRAGKLVLASRRDVEITEQKDITDIATNADLESEKLIIGEIKQKYPDHHIYSEEAGEVGKKSDFEWIIDPLDGTKEYYRGIPLYNVSIALSYKGETIVGVVYRPSTYDLYSASIEDGSYWNEKKANLSQNMKIKKAIIYCYVPSYKRDNKSYEDSWRKLESLGKIVYRLRTSADENSALCWLASGGTEAYVNISNPPKSFMDIEPGLFIARQSGAMVTDIYNNDIDMSNISTIIASNNKNIHEKIIESVSS